MIKSFFGILSFVLSFGGTIPYCFEIIKGKAKPSRSTRVLFLLLILVTLIVQHSAFTSWTLMLTIGELATQLVLFGLGLKYGIGGLSFIDLICYVAFGISLTAYLLTKDAALSLTLLISTDAIAFIPTLVKIWKDPSTDSWRFFVVAGMLAALASFLARNSNSYVEILFPLYIFIANGLAAFPIIVHEKHLKNS